MSIRSSIPAASVIAQRPAEESLSVIDRNSTVDGSLNTTHDLRIEGRVDGTLRCDGVLHVAPGAEIDADVSAAAVIVEGALNGVVHCHGRLEVRSTGVVRADVETDRLVIHEGGRIEGRVMMRLVEPENAVEPPPAESTPSPPADTSPTNPPNSPFLRSYPDSRTGQSPEGDDLPGTPSDEDEPLT